MTKDDDEKKENKVEEETPKEEDKETSDTTEKEKDDVDEVELREIRDEVYGQRLMEEKPDMVKEKLAELRKELALMAETEEGKAYKEASQKCDPSIMEENDPFLLLFLRCCKFQVKPTAKRMLHYWKDRMDIFEDERAFMPLTLTSGVLKHDRAALERGLIQLTETQDDDGRQVIFLDPSRQDKNLYERKSMGRVLWVMFHIAMMKESTTIVKPKQQEKKEDDEDKVSTEESFEASMQGNVVVVNFLKNVKISQLDRGLVKLIASSLQGSLPLRLAAMHVVYPPIFFSIVFGIISIFMGDKLKKRVRNHGSRNLLEKLSKPFGLTEDKLPTEVGGTLQLNYDAWLKEQLGEQQEEKEEKDEKKEEEQEQES